MLSPIPQGVKNVNTLECSALVTGLELTKDGHYNRIPVSSFVVPLLSFRDVEVASARPVGLGS